MFAPEALVRVSMVTSDLHFYSMLVMARCRPIGAAMSGLLRMRLGAITFPHPEMIDRDGNRNIFA